MGAWSAWVVYQLRSDNTAAAQFNINKIKTTVEQSYDNDTGFNNPEFFNIVRSIFNENPELEIVTIYSHDEDRGIEYHYNRGVETQLLNLEESSPLTKKDLPEYKYNQLMKTKLTSSLQADGKTGLDMDLIYQVVDRKAIYNILIRILVIVIVLFFTTLFMIFAVSRKKPSPHVDNETDDFESDTDSDDDLSLDWDDNGFDMESSKQVESSEPDFDDFNLEESSDSFGDFDLNEASDDMGELNLEDASDDFGDLNLDDASNDFGDVSLDDASDDMGELNLDDASDDMGELNLDDASDDFGDLNLDDASDDMGDLNLDDASDDMGELNLDDASDDFGDLDINESGGDFEDINLDDTDSDFGDLNLGGEDDMELESDMNFDDIKTDIPEEEDLLAMDHETAPADDMDDFDFDEMEDSFTEDTESTDDSKSLYSPKSGVGWEDFIEERVNLELERAASFDQDLVMGVIQCESLTEDNYKIFADQLKEDFNYPDMIFEYKDKGFAIIVPNNDLDEALHTLETFTGKEQEQYGEINVGISSRNGRLITGSRIFMEAENALHKAVEDTEKNIVGFRSDPDKFRDFLSNKS